VTAALGAWASRPVELAPETLAQLSPVAGLAVADTGASPVLDRAAGETSRWALVSRPARTRDGDAWALVIGATPAVSNGTVAATTAAVMQIQIALEGAEAHRALALRASTDQLTGLANRSAFLDALCAAGGSGTPTSVLYLDLDGFRTINDAHGHTVGDEVLRHIAARLRTGRREADVCARLGGDEFALVLPHTGEAEARGIGRRLAALVAAPISTTAGTIRIDVSWGAATGDDDRDLLGEADAAMYAHKQSRRAEPAPHVRSSDPSR
jgi:diguanylate cyclase (GGDEF)-like protein